MQEAALHGLLRAAVDLDTLMDAVRGIEGAGSPAKKPDVKALMQVGRHIAKTRQIVVSSQLPGVDIRSRNEIRQCISKLGAHPFITVDAEAPFLRAIVQSELLLSAVASPWLDDKPNGEALTFNFSYNFDSLICRF
jgi:hypothetical protein